jgi:hypothetical protein
MLSVSLLKAVTANATEPCGSPTVLAGSLSAVANWLELNVRRSLDNTAQGRAHQQAEAEIAGALSELAWRLARLDQWTDLLR